MLDTLIFSSIIYIWYEVVDLNPHVVTFEVVTCEL